MMNKLTKARISQYCNVTNIVDKKSYQICLYAGAKSFPDPQIKSSAGGIRMDFFFSSQYISNLCPDLYLLGQQDGNPIQICTNEMFIHNTYIYIYMICIIYPTKSAIYMRIRPILNIRRTDQFPFRKNIFLSLYLTNSILYREVLLLVVMYDTLSDNTTGDRIIALLYLMHIFWKIVTP